MATSSGSFEITLRETKPTILSPYLYNTQIEIFIAVRDLELRYGDHSRNAGSKIPPSFFETTMIGFWKPPGALQWVEKCVTETIYKERNPRFAMKMNIAYDTQDANGIELKFQLFEGNYFGPQKTVFMRTLGVVETNLSRLLAVGSVGLLVPLEFPEEREISYKRRHQVVSAQSFLRAEILKPIEDAVILQFGIIQKQTATRQFFSKKCLSYYMELLKINEGINFEINHPYSLIHRSEPLNSSINHCWTHLIIPIVRVCNGDLDRVLKIVIYDSNQTYLIDGERNKTGFVLTTLRKLLELTNEISDPRNRKLPIVKCKDGKDSQKISLLVNQCSIMELAPLETYLQNGLTIKRIYAVDYSSSNWNQSLHKCNLYENEAALESAAANANVAAAPYEQAIELISKIIDPITSGQSVFYSFGNPHMKPFVETLEEKHHLRQLFHHYGEALNEAKIANENFSPFSEDFVSGKCFQKLNINSSASSSSSTGKRTTLLGPLLNDFLALLGLRVANSSSEYFVAFIFTDGEFTDLEESMKLIIELAKYPISLIFIAIGLGNIEFPLSLQEAWVSPVTNEYPKRNIVTVIHFRSLTNWYSAIKYGSSFKSDPMVLLQKEIYTAIDKQVTQYLRISGHSLDI